jgi:hypothetical protein
MMGFELRSDKQVLLDTIKNMPDDIDVLIRDRYNKELYIGARHAPWWGENNIHIIINPRN